MKPGPPAIILFDGWCVFCNGSAAFVAGRDPDGHFRFATLQSAGGRQLLREHGLSEDMNESFVLLEGGRSYLRSAAALRIARRLRSPWPLLSLFVVVPRPLRDAVYGWIGRRRYRWFGRRDSCGIADARVQARLWSPDQDG
jgi:predicted DCC family thiol-disulfide oxidoreductase YuxK